MKIMVINPNESQAMTAMIEKTCAAYLSPDTQLYVRYGGAGMNSIEGFYDGALATPGVLRHIEYGEKDGINAYIIACADDTGLDAGREIATGPVVGIGQVAMHAASMLGAQFSLLTAQRKSIHVLKSNARRYGFANQCAGVHALDIPVLDLEADDADLNEAISQHAQHIVHTDAAEVLVLGCAGLSRYRKQLEVYLNLPVVDGLAVAITFAEGLFKAGLSTSKANTYRRAAR
ncbi:MAG: aspartate/glutamate racemase family protein [Gammaproteobacteria bacterium]|nr:aspartate/glutamate racemase family protein [Gammaproteobacteria bacterium]